MERLQRKCGSISDQVKSISDYANNIDPEKASLKALEKKAEAVEGYRARYEEVYEQLYEEAVDDNELKIIKAHFVQFQALCNQTYDTIQKLIEVHFPVEEKSKGAVGGPELVTLVKELMTSQKEMMTSQEKTTRELMTSQEKTTRDLLTSVKEMIDKKTEPVKSIDSSDSSLAKLPKLDLKTFSGGYTYWREFYDTFRCAVHDRKGLAPVQKLQYLKSCLKGEAADLVKSLTLKDENYALALQQLKTRYDNLKTIRDAHFHNMFSLSQLNAKSASGLRKVCSKMYENVQALHNLGEPTEYWDSLLIYILKNKLDPETRMEWEKHVTSDDHPKFRDMITFLNEFASAIESSEPRSVNKSRKQESSCHTQQATSSNSAPKDGCFLCKGSHRLPQCSQFLALSPEQRKAKATELKLCLNCFSRQHFVASCVKPPSCSQCSGKHHPTLHYVRGPDSVNLASHVAFPVPEEVLLSTALVKVETNCGQTVARALIDPGSQSSFVTSSFVQRSRLRKSKKKGVHVCGIGGIEKGDVNELVECDLLPVHKQCVPQKVPMEAFVIDKITGSIPRHRVNIRNWSQLQSLQLADEQFQTPGPVDILIGADVYPHIISDNMKLIKSPDRKLIAQETVFGWVLSGKVSRQNSKTGIVSPEPLLNHFGMVTYDDKTECILKKFWEIETVEQACAWSVEEKMCEAHFVETCIREPSGRYAVVLPLKDGVSLGESRSKAEFRLKQNERRFLRESEALYDKYNEVVEEYFNLDHAEAVPQNELCAGNVYYMPHHGVVRESSSTTKLRVVFDASAKTSNGLSLNDCLMVGPKIQDDLVDILLRFRTHPIGISADIAKMYRQVKLRDTATKDYHRFLWRQNPSDEIKDYRMKVVTFGVASSPYHAQRALKQVALDDRDKFPLAAPVVENDFYMDDLMSGIKQVADGIALRNELTDMLAGAGFELRKWSASDLKVLEGVPLCDREIQDTLDLDYDKAITKTLGVYWNPASDTFLYKVNFSDASSDSAETVVTKRQLLSESARVFDPLGLISPTVMCAKIMFQNLWVLGLKWDDPLPAELLRHWLKWKGEMTSIDNLKYARCIVPKYSDVIDSQLHGFGDASEKGYSAVVYLRTVSVDQKVLVSLVCAKTKVAPIKQISLPRLELCAALLVARLLDKVRSAMKLTTVSLHGWSDSTVTLDWIRSSPNRLKTFVANRVSEIQDIVSPSQWRYCPTAVNPADCASRGIMPNQLITHELWWNGPTWLSESSDNWPEPHRSSNKTEVGREMKPVIQQLVSHVTELKPGNALSMFPFSTLSRIVRVSAWCFRWLRIYRSRKDASEPLKPYLTCPEWRHALDFWIKVAQNEHFHDDIERLKAKEALLNKSRLLSLCPFVDKHGLLRVGGRLGLSNLPYRKRHPALLPRKHELTRLIIIFEHRINLHAGPQDLQAALRQRYWIIGARDLVRHIVHKCVLCRKRRAELIQQLMGMLPIERTMLSRPFLNTGVDYAGPLLIKTRPRGPSQKCWVALFVCFAVKAIHLELVTSASTPAFLAALRRFIARRGKPSNMYSDNGSNFLGANRELRELKLLLDSETHNEIVANNLAHDNISWHYNPASAPHFGGLWEAGVKSVKRHLKHVVGGTALSYEEMTTVLCQIEACLNSRPLCPMSSDPSDLQVLTPGHFLIGTELNSVPEPNLRDVPVSRLNRWQHVQLLHQHFWNRWSNEYLSRLQQRPKWQNSRANLEIGDIVLIKEDNLPPLKWLTGRVVELHPGKDNLVRVVTVKTAGGTYKRPVVKLSLILGSDETDTC